MVKYRTKIRLPFRLEKHLATYLEDDEEIVDILHETWVPSFDFRWLLLTNIRIIQISYIWFEYHFRDVHFDGIDLQFTEGFFYDSVRVKSMTDDYRAHFYSFNRARTRDFMQKIEDEKERAGYESKKEEVQMQHHVLEDLILEGEIPVEQDRGHEEKMKKLKKEAKKPKKPEEEKKEPLDIEDGIKAIGEIDNLKYEGILSEEEYEKKKKDILGRI